MIVDCHMHYEPAMFPLERMLVSMEKHGIEKTALIPTMVEPFSLEGRPKAMAGDLMRASLLYAGPSPSPRSRNGARTPAWSV